MDVSVLLSHILPVFKQPRQTPRMREAVLAYEEDMIARTRPAVLASRRAAMDAHEYRKIDADSPLVSKRVVIREELD